MHVRAYLQASTKEQDVNRAGGGLHHLADERGIRIAPSYVESENGASLNRPELFEPFTDFHRGNILLVK